MKNDNIPEQSVKGKKTEAKFIEHVQYADSQAQAKFHKVIGHKLVGHDVLNPVTALCIANDDPKYVPPQDEGFL